VGHRPRATACQEPCGLLGEVDERRRHLRRDGPHRIRRPCVCFTRSPSNFRRLIGVSRIATPPRVGVSCTKRRRLSANGASGVVHLCAAQLRAEHRAPADAPIVGRKLSRRRIRAMCTVRTLRAGRPLRAGRRCPPRKSGSAADLSHDDQRQGREIPAFHGASCALVAKSITGRGLRCT